MMTSATDVFSALVGRAGELLAEKGEGWATADIPTIHTSLRDLRLDSMEQVELISDLEVQFEVEIDDHRMREAQTVGDVCNAIAGETGDSDPIREDV
uniref:Acyl carrier protein/phosphopantetheine-binding protein n=1 Tax=Rathayibacter iranicus TaxID=59737 RepID=A0A5J6SGG8_9MICO|nr:acyl carrier protein/phosphopantetheine-binding protein [Rathayibacter iranicus]QFF92414.1 acyl carrier protein/phosphopantetheine-binding protein [Rathayibacter iranicus]